jgi:nicotinamide-nucleotide amidase
MPSAEIVSIGTELLLGDVLDTNSQFLAIELAKLGIDCFYRTTVGDNRQRIAATIRQALRRADIVITTGGLGPTADDLTMECIAEALGVPLYFDQSIFEHIAALFQSRNWKMPDSNRKQAFRPEGADVLPNSAGSAPGILWSIDIEHLKKVGIVGSTGAKEEFFAAQGTERLIMTFPGVPRELKVMWRETAAKHLTTKYVAGTLWSCELKHYGIGESALAEKYSHLLNLANPTVAPYAGAGECRLRVAAKAESEEAARKLAEPIVDEIKNGSGVLCYGVDDDTLESVVGSMLVEQGKTVTTAESCTGGLVSVKLTDIPGSSKYVTLNLVTYSNDAKEKLLKVPASILETYGAVSPECAEAMAKGAKEVSGSDIAISITGIAGPEGGTKDKPVGLVYLGLAATDRQGKPFYFGKKLKLGEKAPRLDIRHRTANEALNVIRLFLIDPNLFA